MSILSPALFKQDVQFLGVTLPAEIANSIWINIMSYGLIGVLFYGLIQIFHIAKGRGFQKNLDPISLSFLIVPMVVFNDEMRTFLFMR